LPEMAGRVIRASPVCGTCGSDHPPHPSEEPGIPVHEEFSLPIPCRLRSRMKLPVYFLQPRGIDMGVDLGCGNAGVSEHFLNLAQVGSPSQ
jgi:hypothetical protein